MESSATVEKPSDELLFHDGFGDRLLLRDSSGEPHQEALLLRAQLTAVPSFEFSLNKRLAQLETFEHPAFIRIHRLARVGGDLPRLSVVSDHAAGPRLSDVLTAMQTGGTRPSVGAVLFL